MEKKQVVEREVAETLKGLEHPERLQSDPYFHSRLMAKIETRQQNKQRPFSRFLLKPVLIPALCAFIILVNMTSVVWVLKDNSSETYNRETYLTAFAAEYSLNHYYTDVFTVNQ